MKKYWVKRAVKFLMIAVVAIAVLGFVVMNLWNSILVAVLHVSVITFWQAVGIFVLDKILFGGFKGRGGGFRGGMHGGPWKNDMGEKWEGMREKWHNMTPEERQKFKQEWRNKCRGGWRRDFDREPFEGRKNEETTN